MQATLDHAEMLSAFLEGDARYDGRFWTGVKTTGIFCRPTCKARKPLPRNVEFFETTPDALRAGYRPCKRCKPLEDPDAIPDWAQRLMDAVAARPERRLTDADLRDRKVDPVRARRWFQVRYGVTFQGWQRAWRLSGAMRALRSGKDLDGLPESAGYESASGFREAFARLFGEAPGKLRAELGEALSANWVETLLGPMLAVASEECLVLLEFVDRRGLECQIKTLRRRFGKPVVPGTNAVLDQTRREIDEYFQGERQRFDVPIDAPGSEFEVRVWKALRAVPYGSTVSYGELAKRAGRPGAARPTGRANGANRLALVLPCHRVVGADGALTGYAGGVQRKQWLLDHEARVRGNAQG
ncbi:MAG: AraC family transcriptional regulator of adaptative response [Planctomycetota bacterium]|jgi:AraC family transcriptional regulator of adaptative response/methylated-DNA-[protein]-cysteine methyltransferase